MADERAGSRLAACLVEPGLWIEATGRTDWPAGRPALFLDRDGTINVDTGYPGHPDEIVLKEEIVAIIQAGNEVHIPVVVATNQSGIARSYFGWPEFAAVNQRVLDLLAAHGCSVDLVIANGFYPGVEGPLGIADPPMRKPSPGMLLFARDRLRLDLSRSILVGDKPSDMEAAQRAGLASAWLVGQGGAAGLPGFSVRALDTDADRLELIKAIRGLSESAPAQ